MVGYHSPELTQEVLDTLITVTNHKWVDTSWHNDECDSVCSDTLDLHIYIPHSELDHTTYTVCRLSTYGTGDDEQKEFKNLNALLKYITNDEF